jgi:hypothetical protein
VREFMIHIASALGAAHANHVVHRDIKPSNVMVSNSDSPKRFVLTDFGISRIAEGVQLQRYVGGTHQFMAPEQIRGRPVAASDFWALGVTSYWLLAGKLPFQGDSIDQLRRSILFDTPLPPSQFTRDVPDDISLAVQRMLDKNPVNRLGDSRELTDLIKGDARLPTPALLQRTVAQAGSEPPRLNTWSEAKEKQIRQAWICFWITAVLVTIPGGIVGPALLMAGLVLLFFAQAGKTSVKRVIAAMGLLVLGSFAYFVYWMFLATAVLGEEGLINIASWLDTLLTVILAVVAVHYLARARRLRRELFVMGTFAAGGQSEDERLATLRSHLDVHLGDLDLHARYVEGLLAAGRAKEAIVEAKMMLHIDPYNLGASLLLAHAYFELGLFAECEQVCNGYLAVSGQCFEFSDLGRRCKVDEGTIG